MKIRLLYILCLSLLSSRNYAMEPEAPITKEALQTALSNTDGILGKYKAYRRSDSDKDRQIKRYEEENKRIREGQK
jgi:hypothetical protein